MVCAVNGVAAGAGANLALACDIVLAARSARFIQAFCRIGLVPDSGGTYFLPRLIGEARARALALTGEPVSAEQALAWGLIWQVVDDERLQAEARSAGAAAGDRADQGPGADQARAERLPRQRPDRQLDLERDLQREAGRTADYREGVAAFVAKRPAVFRGA